MSIGPVVDDRAAREKARLESNTGPGRKQAARAKNAPPISLVTDATADLRAPIFLIAASPIIIRQGYFKRLRFDLPFLLPASTLCLHPIHPRSGQKALPFNTSGQAAGTATRTCELLYSYTRLMVHVRY